MAESRPTIHRGIAAAWALLVFIDGLFFLENTPIRTAPAAVLWLTVALLVAGVVGFFGRSGMLHRPDGAGQTPLGPTVRWRTGEFWLKFVAAAAAGGACALIAPPVNLHQIHWFAFLPMFWALHPNRFWENFAVGWAYGTFALTLIFYWVVQTIALYSNIPSPAAFALLLLGSGALFGWLYLPAWLCVHPLRRRFGVGWIALFPTVLVACEFFVSFIIIFPWQMGVAHYRSAAIWQLASITGVWGVSWLVAFVNAGLAEVLYRKREGRPLPVAALATVAATLLVAFGWGWWRYDRIDALLAEGKQIRVAQLQSPHDMVYRLGHPARQSFEEWVRRTQTLSPGEADLTVWPEGASPYDLNEGMASDVVGELARRYQTEMIVGGGTRERVNDPTLGTQVRQFNSVFYFDDSGALAGRYDKMVPLLFGEYLPWWLDWLHSYVQGIGSFQDGTEATVFEMKHANASAPICYEAIFGEVCRRYSGANLLVNVTNDAWFGDTAAPHQHGMLAALRATELGMPMIRSAYSGISFVVEPHGRIHSETVPFTEVARVVDVRLASVSTVYSRLGDWFAWLCVLIAVASGSVAGRDRKTLSTKDQSGQGSG